MNEKRDESTYSSSQSFYADTPDFKDENNEVSVDTFASYRDSMHDSHDHEQNYERKRKRRILITVAVIIVLLVIAANSLIVTFANRPQTIEESVGGWFYDQDASTIQTAIDKSVKEGYFNMTINTNIPVQGNEAYAGIMNIEANTFDCIVTITLDDGTVVYTSGGIMPGQELKVITLNQALATGEYQATATFEIFDRNEEHTRAGQTAARVVLVVR